MTSIEKKIEKYKERIKAMYKARKQRIEICNKLFQLRQKVIDNIEQHVKSTPLLSEIYEKLLKTTNGEFSKFDKWTQVNVIFSIAATRKKLRDMITYHYDKENKILHLNEIKILAHPIQYTGKPFRGNRYVQVDIKNRTYRLVSSKEAEDHLYLDILDWVGTTWYKSLIHFLAEALELGVSRRCGVWLEKFIPGLSKLWLIVESKICIFIKPRLVFFSLNPEKCIEKIKEMLKDKYEDEKIREIVEQHVTCEHLSAALLEYSARGCGTIRPGKYLRW